MKAVVQHGFGGLEVLSCDDVPEPTITPRDVLVRTGATALNRLDILQREGPPLLPGFSLPHIAGMDVAGTVVAIGGEVDSLGVGDRVVLNPSLRCGTCDRCLRGDDGLCEAVRVIGATCPGGYAELCVAPSDHAYKLPAGISFEHAATVPTVYSTAWHALVAVAQLRIGETLLVHGAGSGVSIAAIQIAKCCGARVIVTSRFDRKLELARQFGADAVVNIASQDLAEACREITDGEGVDVAFDHVGPALFQQTILALRPRGRLVFCGSTTGREATFDLPYAYHFGISLLGSDPYRTEEFGKMLEFYWESKFDPIIDSRFPLCDAAAAQARMESDEIVGKVLLLP